VIDSAISCRTDETPAQLRSAKTPREKNRRHRASIQESSNHAAPCPARVRARCKRSRPVFRPIFLPHAVQVSPDSLRVSNASHNDRISIHGRFATNVSDQHARTSSSPQTRFLLECRKFPYPSRRPPGGPLIRSFFSFSLIIVLALPAFSRHHLPMPLGSPRATNMPTCSRRRIQTPPRIRILPRLERVDNKISQPTLADEDQQRQETAAVLAQLRTAAARSSRKKSPKTSRS